MDSRENEEPRTDKHNLATGVVVKIIEDWGAIEEIREIGRNQRFGMMMENCLPSGSSQKKPRPSDYKNDWSIFLKTGSQIWRIAAEEWALTTRHFCSRTKATSPWIDVRSTIVWSLRINMRITVADWHHHSAAFAG